MRAALAGEATPAQRAIVGGEVVVGGALVGAEVVVVVEAGGVVPEEAVDGLEAVAGGGAPGDGVGGVAERGGDEGEVALVLVEESVEVDGGEVLRGAAEGAEAEAGVEAGFAHGAVALRRRSAVRM